MNKESKEAYLRKKRDRVLSAKMQNESLLLHTLASFTSAAANSSSLRRMPVNPKLRDLVVEFSAME